MPFLRVTEFHQAWDQYLDHLVRLAVGFVGWSDECFVVAPRGQQTWELAGQAFRVMDLRNNILVNTGRDLNYRFMLAEFLWIAFGRNDVAALAQYNKRIADYSDDGKVLFGSYGTRLKHQWPRIIENLTRDPMSRQAVATIFEPNMQVATKDTPCTISLQWLARKDRLNCIVTMRSNDIWLGLPYDFYTFSQLTNCLAGHLGLEPGWLQMQQGSLHLYQQNLEAAQGAIRDWKSYTLRSEKLPGFPPSALERRLEQPSHSDAEVLRREFVPFSKALLAPSKAHALGVLKEFYGSKPTVP